MKKTFLSLLMVAATTAAFGQGAITWGNNYTGNFIPIYGPDPANPTNSITGNSALGKPSGTTVYGGPLLTGTGYTFEFFAGPTSGSLALIAGASTTFRTSTSTAQVLPKGLVNGGTVTVPGAPLNTPAFYQYVVWNNLNGTVTDWATARTHWQAGLLDAGQSPIIQSAVLGGSDTNVGVVPTPNANGFVSFNTYTIGGVIPEPATFGLFGLGAAALLIFRRRK